MFVPISLFINYEFIAMVTFDSGFDFLPFFDNILLQCTLPIPNGGTLLTTSSRYENGVAPARETADKATLLLESNTMTANSACLL